MQKESKIYVLLENGVRIAQGRLVKELEIFYAKRVHNLCTHHIF